MSYRGFKRLIGESGLERKCRYLLGAGVILLMSASFIVYARQTEALAFDQLQNAGQALVPLAVVRVHTKPELRESLDRFQTLTADDLPSSIKGYIHKLRSAIPGGNPDLQLPGDELPVFQAFQQDPGKTEQTFLNPADKSYLYYAPVRAGKSCVNCHRSEKEVANPIPDIKDGDLMGMVYVRMSTELIETGFMQGSLCNMGHVNWRVVVQKQISMTQHSSPFHLDGITKFLQ